MHASHPWLARAGHVKPQPGRSWLITFSDLICLLLSFFVLLYAMRAPDARKFDRVRAALAHLPPAAAPPGGRFDVGVPPERAPAGADYLAPLLARHFAAEPALLPVHIERGEDRVILDLPLAVLFPGGQNAVGPEGRRMLLLIGGALDRLRNPVEVVAPVLVPVQAGGEDAAMAWPAAINRALAVAGTLRETGFGRDVTATARVPAPAGDASDAPPSVLILVRTKTEPARPPGDP